ncbi:MAG TPA: aldehyde dehydrogenase family protein [Candidatus Limnocylindria bacterium]|nr:aldehyde dehydrogenase family protein [Candidatus Limnocylindria bacterium]
MTTTARFAPLLVDGEERPSDSGERFETRDPATGEVIAEVAAAGRPDVDAAVAAARRAFGAGGEWEVPANRVRALNRAAVLIRERAEQLAALESRDTGKPISQARADAAACARYFEFYAGAADKLDGRSIPLGPGFVDYTVREPWGVCAVVIPWNYPLQIAGRSVAAALAAGNAIVLKPAREAPLTCVELARICLEAGVPRGWFNVLNGSGENVGMPLVTHAAVDHVSFTGSAAVGAQIGEACARLIRPVVMELGGKSPQIVFDDADVERALPFLLRAIVQNAGQTCSAGARLLAHRRLRERVVALVGERMRALRIGPGSEDPDLGPLISAEQRRGVLERARQALDAGARLVTGGREPDDERLASGYFLEATLFDDVDPSLPIFREEVFGPVLVAAPFDDEDEAVALANATEYGLVAAVWTNDLGRAHRVARRIRAGQVFVNTYGAGGGIELPFGGYRRSGHGRGKGIEGILEYTQVKNVCVAL